MEKRVYQRAPFLCRLTLSTGGGSTFEGSSVDISLGGVGVISTRPVPSGQTVMLTFHLRGGANESIPGRVVNMRSSVDGSLLGVEFQEPLVRSRWPELTKSVERL